MRLKFNAVHLEGHFNESALTDWRRRRMGQKQNSEDQSEPNHQKGWDIEVVASTDGRDNLAQALDVILRAAHRDDADARTNTHSSDPPKT